MKASKTSLFAALGFTILVAALVPSLSDARGFGFKFGFANRVAGSYLGTFQLDPVDSMEFPLVPALFMFNRDGTALGSFADEGDIGTPMYGSWRKTGKHEISGTFIDFTYFPTGAHGGSLRAEFIQEFDEHFNTFVGTVIVNFFALGVDPLDPNSPVAFDPLTGTVTGQRIPADTGQRIPADADDDDDDDDDDD